MRGLGYAVREIQPILRHNSPRTKELYLRGLSLEDVRETLENLPTSSKKAEVIEFDKTLDTGESGGRKLKSRLKNRQSSER